MTQFCKKEERWWLWCKIKMVAGKVCRTKLVKKVWETKEGKTLGFSCPLVLTERSNNLSFNWKVVTRGRGILVGACRNMSYIFQIKNNTHQNPTYARIFDSNKKQKCLKMTFVWILVYAKHNEFGQQFTLNLLNSWLFWTFDFVKVMGRVITLEAHGFDASTDVWKFAKDAYGSIF